LVLRLELPAPQPLELPGQEPALPALRELRRLVQPEPRELRVLLAWREPRALRVQRP